MEPNRDQQLAADALSRLAGRLDEKGEEDFFVGILRGVAKMIRIGEANRAFAILRRWTPIRKVNVVYRPGVEYVDVDIVPLRERDRSN